MKVKSCTIYGATMKKHIIDMMTLKIDDRCCFCGAEMRFCENTTDYFDCIKNKNTAVIYRFCNKCGNRNRYELRLENVTKKEREV